MSNQVTPEERQVAFKYGLTEAQYVKKREEYAAKQGSTVEALSQTSSEDIHVMNALAKTADEYQKHKLTGLAEKVILGV